MKVLLFAALCSLVHSHYVKEIPFNCYNENCGARQEPWPEDLKSPFPCHTRSPINVNTTTARLLTTVPPLVVQAATSEQHFLKNTGYECTITSTKDSDTRVTGSIFGKSVYIFEKTTFSFSQNSSNKFAKTVNGEGTPFIIITYLRKSEYKTFEEAKKHRDGVLMILVNVRVIKGPDNPVFTPFGNALTYIEKPNSCLYVTGPLGAFLFLFFLVAPISPEIIYYPGSYYHEGIEHDGIVIQFVTYSYISENQFQRLKALKNIFHQPLNTEIPVYPSCNRPIVKQFGVLSLVSLKYFLESFTNLKQTDLNFMHFFVPKYVTDILPPLPNITIPPSLQPILEQFATGFHV